MSYALAFMFGSFCGAIALTFFVAAGRARR